MGLFDWVMKGIGFESDDDGYSEQSGDRKKKKKKSKRFGNREEEFDSEIEDNQSFSVYDKDQYNALKDDDENNSYSNDYGSSYGGYSSFGNGTASYGSKNFVFFNPSNYEDIKNLVEYLKQGEPAIVNLDHISESEAQRSLDFVSGAACALGGKLQRITGNYFLVTPDGYNITKPAGQK